MSARILLDREHRIGAGVRLGRAVGIRPPSRHPPRDPDYWRCRREEVIVPNVW